MTKRTGLAIALVAALAIVGIGGAAMHFGLFSPHPQEALDAFNAVYDTEGTRLDTCNTCHTSGRNTNHYGTDLKSRFRVLTSSGGSDMTHEESIQQFRTAIKAIENNDSDQDGYSNVNEIRARTFPGDALDYPAEQ